MTNTARTLIAALLIAFTAPACTSNEDANQPSDGVVMVWEQNRDSQPNRPDLDLNELAQTPNANDRPTTDLDNDGWDQLADPNNTMADAICACEDGECQDNWVESNFGCGVCVLAACGQASQGGCSPACQTETAPPPSQTDPINENLGAI